MRRVDFFQRLLPRKRTTINNGSSPRARDDADAGLIPSRDAILRALGDAGVPMPADDLARALRVTRAARDAFEGRVAAMKRDGQILANRKGELCVVAKLDLVVGRVQ